MDAAENLVDVLGSMKGVAMKVGQAMSVFDLGLVPESRREEFRAKLAALRDQAPVVSAADMRGVIEEDLGPMKAVFSDFDDSPLAAASIGQVHRARLLDGRDVVVKVQYPGIDAAVRSDVRNMAAAMVLMRALYPSLNTAMIDEITQQLEGELDYLREAHTQHQVAARYRDHPFVHVPDAVVAHCSPRVLVTDYLDGVGFDDMSAAPQDDRNIYGELIFRFYVSSLYIDHEFGGDPHPGNVLLCRDGRVGFVDFGLHQRMDPVHVGLEKAVLCGAVERRAEDVYRLAVERGIVDRRSKVAPRDVLEYVWSTCDWFLRDEPVCMTAELATTSLVLAMDPTSSEFAAVTRQHLPPEHLFARRAAFMTAATLGQLAATNNWHRLAREWLYDEPSQTDIGRQIARWRSSYR
ncbi:AarF/ABC1/UbiB kinase family protein [Arthrobacter sp. SLBN-53]|uniref:ABC1 kinase family protein n=1 Tax=Arthrobacter sp. SLBN-53 TaxID=2768412 RepID=UPI001C206086|nr:AarF/ABC1/UbiB kinase family protein [Arthrobacter sp. SLBN-53]